MIEEKAKLLTNTQLSRRAVIYVRQSTLRQTVENTESTQKQYALKERARTLGWPIDRIGVIDCDQGHSGASSEGRTGFQQLVAAVGLGEVGLVLGLEVSRLARNSSDWHRLLELCSMTQTWISDEDGLYDPQAFNDRLLLGLKGTMSEAELHVLRARLRGGILNKARRGELALQLPVGLVRTLDSQVVLDPDVQVRKVLTYFFEIFRRTGSASKTVRTFRKEGVLFPFRERTGPGKGTLSWGAMTHDRALKILHNPCYAGAFVYGRRRCVRFPDGKCRIRDKSQEEWTVLIPDAHPGYIGWADYQENLTRLRDNAQAHGAERPRGPAREGCALLQGLVLCGRCGQRMTVRYESRGKKTVPVYVCQRSAIEGGMEHAVCQSVTGHRIDRLVGERVLSQMEPTTMETVLAVQRELLGRAEEVLILYRQTLDRLRHEAVVAETRYRCVDPANRLVASTLEADWNASLTRLSQAQEELMRKEEEKKGELDAQLAEALQTIPQTFERLWNDPETPDREKKRWIRLLVEDVTLLKQDSKIDVHLRYRGGMSESHALSPSLKPGDFRKTDEAVVAEIDRLLENMTDSELVEELANRGCLNAEGGPYQCRHIQSLRHRYRLPNLRERMERRGWRTLKEVALALEISPPTLLDRVHKGLVPARIIDNRGTCLFPPEVELALGGLKGKNSVSQGKTP